VGRVDELGRSGKNNSMNTNLTFTGGCYCGDVRYQCEGPTLMNGLCYCRTCQAISGGAGNLFMAVDARSFKFTKGTPRAFNKNDRLGSPTRHFCETCGVHLTARSERAPTAVLIKVGTLDDPSVFEGPQLVTWTSEMQLFHILPSGVPAHPEFPRPKGSDKGAAGMPPSGATSP
jgi:hypothetical protein